MSKTRHDNVEWQAGYDAFKNGLPVDSCPYRASEDLDSRYERWVTGWNNALADSQDVERV